MLTEFLGIGLVVSGFLCARFGRVSVEFNMIQVSVLQYSETCSCRRCAPGRLPSSRASTLSFACFPDLLRADFRRVRAPRLPWRSSCTTSLQKLMMFSCARQWLETARAQSTRGEELVPANRSRALRLCEASCKESRAPPPSREPPSSSVGGAS